MLAQTFYSRCAGFFLFFQCSAFSFPSSLIHSITPTTLKDYVTHIPDAKAQRWVEDNADFLAYLARMPYPLSNWIEKYDNGNWHLFSRGIKNHAYTNFVFQIPDSTYWIQIAGPKHRVRNVYTYNTNQNSYEYLEIAKHWELRNSYMLDGFQTVATYQTISRFAQYLLLEEALINCAHEQVRIAPTYLVHIPGYSTLVCDEHYIVVQKDQADITRLRDAPERIKSVSAQALSELCSIINATGYWNSKNGLYIDRNNNLVLLDYEQRNIENPHDFFFKDVLSFEQCVYHGIADLMLVHLKPYAPDAYQAVQWFIIHQPNVRYSSIWQKYEKLLI